MAQLSWRVGKWRPKRFDCPETLLGLMTRWIRECVGGIPGKREDLVGLKFQARNRGFGVQLIVLIMGNH